MFFPLEDIFVILLNKLDMKIDKLLKIAEDENWIVNCDKPNEHCPYISLEFESYTDIDNQDVIMSISIKNDDPEELVSEIEGYWENFDPEEEASLWIKDGHGINGAPHSLKDIIKSMEEAKSMMRDLWRRMKNSLYGDVKNVLLFKKNYRDALDEIIEAGHHDALILATNFISMYKLNDNYYGECFIMFKKSKIDVESIWTDGFSGAWIHASCEAFECDINLADLSAKNARRVMRFLYRKYMERVNTGYYDNL